MTELMRRRRALMGAQGSGGGGGSALWEWVPADGLTPLNIINAESATITDNVLHIVTKAAMGFGKLSPTDTITWPDRYKITVEISDIGGNNINFYITSRLDAGRNNSVILRKLDAKVRVVGAAKNDTSLSPFPSSATVSLIIDKIDEQVTAEVGGVTYGPYNIATGTSSAIYLIGFEGYTTSHYIDIAHILIEDMT